MAISFEKAFGLHPATLALRSKNAELIAGNIANADTPGYKAKGMDFQSALLDAKRNQSQGMARTNAKHIDSQMALNNGVDFRAPNQADTGDGNTVDSQVERNLYLENSMYYQASLEFMNGKIKGLKKVISGGQS